MDAAMAVTNATQQIVNAAALAQQERIKKGVGSKGDRYHSDPMWTEGLISAAKGVAEATRHLVQFSNKAAQGQIDDTALIAASKSVSASTAQLLSATRSKSETGSQSQATLDTAASAVKKATTSLVDAARSFASQEELEKLKKADSFAGNVRAEMDQQALIIRLEKELNSARQELFDMRKEKYADAKILSPRVMEDFNTGAPVPVLLPTKSQGQANLLQQLQQHQQHQQQQQQPAFSSQFHTPQTYTSTPQFQSPQTQQSSNPFL
eukprot:TRINITY_DN1284_c0_g1_i1.p1 TRINITY_DN1284_c0_g1~~TRINITY_DN1284_c0_g1_i1.p1  ORF type:complete len:265 (+),score=99.64 TRINITY_DN1284_c0_g1_i1:527-1321(+)